MRDPAPVDPRDPQAVTTWLAAVTSAAAEIHDLAVDATARKGQRRHARSFLRGSLRRRFHALSQLLAALAAPPLTPPDGAA